MQDQIFFIAVAVFGGIIATATDFHKHWVPDFVNYGMVFIGLLGHGILSIITKSYTPILYSAIGFGIFFGLANLMFYTGIWGGGDSKLLMGYGALLPMISQSAHWPSFVTLFSNIVFIGFAYSVFYTILISVRKRELFLPELKKTLRKFLPIILMVLVTSIVPIILTITSRVDPIIFYLWILILVLFFFVFVSKAVESSCMFKEVYPHDLEVGDRVIENVRIEGKLIYHPKLVGLEEKDLIRLKELESQGKVRQLKIKEGIPYAAAFLIGLLFTVFFGDLFIIIFGL